MHITIDSQGYDRGHFQMLHALNSKYRSLDELIAIYQMSQSEMAHANWLPIGPKLITGIIRLFIKCSGPLE